ncbi:MAG: DUF2807 domain-containing protein, partial [Cyanobacteria bacterium]|nr:DUF2807 domain-containing protein [Cyanobacteriota bacterium]
KSSTLLTALLATLSLNFGAIQPDNLMFHSGAANAADKDRSPVKTEERQLAHFSGLDLAIPGQVNVTIGKPQKISITCNQNTLGNVITEVSDGILRVKIKDSFNVEKFEANIVMDKLEHLQASCAGHTSVKGLSKAGLKKVAVMGASTATLDDISADQLDVVVAGASNLTGTGNTGKLRLTVSGASRATLPDLKTKECDMKVYSASSASINVSDKATGKVNGASHVKLKGTASANSIAVDFVSKVSRN